MRVRYAIALLVAVVTLGLAAPAFAASSVYYGSAEAPIKAENNSDDGNAWMFGATGVIDQTWLRNRYWYKDSAPGGNAAYVHTTWYFFVCGTGATCWEEAESDRSSDVKDANWHVEMDYVDLDFTAEKGRANTKVCENQNNSPDACSKTVFSTLTY